MRVDLRAVSRRLAPPSLFLRVIRISLQHRIGWGLLLAVAKVRLLALDCQLASLLCPRDCCCTLWTVQVAMRVYSCCFDI